VLKNLFGIFSPKSNNTSYVNWYDKENPKISDYIKNRLEPQINWYNSKAKSNMYRYNVLQVLTLGIAALIPIVNVVEGVDIVIRIISAVLGGMIAAITGLIQLTKAQESWLLYRSTAETLIREYNLYMLKAGDYSEPSLTDEKRDKLFIERVESIMSSEGTKYFSLRQQKSESGSIKG
jgi:hypothetical protein